jgi:hypothetical protein
MTDEWFRPAVSQTILGGDRHESLIAIRDRLAAELDNPLIMPRDVAQVSKQLADVIREIDAIPNASAEVSAVVDINKRRESRRKTAGTQRP